MQVRFRQAGLLEGGGGWSGEGGEPWREGSRGDGGHVGGREANGASARSLARSLSLPP